MEKIIKQNRELSNFDIARMLVKLPKYSHYKANSLRSHVSEARRELSLPRQTQKIRTDIIIKELKSNPNRMDIDTARLLIKTKDFKGYNLDTLRRLINTYRMNLEIKSEKPSIEEVNKILKQYYNKYSKSTIAGIIRKVLLIDRIRKYYKYHTLRVRLSEIINNYET